MNKVNSLPLFLMLMALTHCSDLEEKIAIPERTPNVADYHSVCDGSDNIVLGMRSSTPHTVATNRSFFYENGIQYIYLNGKCEFWTWGILPKKVQNWNGNRMDIMTGKLDEAAALEFLKRVHWPIWEEQSEYQIEKYGTQETLYRVYAGPLSFDFGYQVAQSDPKLAKQVKIADGMESAMRFLIDYGTPYVGESLRLYVGLGGEEGEVSWNHLSPPPFIFNWNPSFSINDLAEEQRNYCPGESRLITGEESARLRAERDRYRSEADKVFNLPWAVLDDSGFHHEIFIREVLPFENEYGFVPNKGQELKPNCDAF